MVFVWKMWPLKSEVIHFHIYVNNLFLNDIIQSYKVDFSVEHTKKQTHWQEKKKKISNE